MRDETTRDVIRRNTESLIRTRAIMSMIADLIMRYQQPTPETILAVNSLLLATDVVRQIAVIGGGFTDEEMVALSRDVVRQEEMMASLDF